MPLLRLWATKNAEAEGYRVRRDRYLTELLDELKQNIEQGTDRPCIAGNVLKDPENVVSDGRL